MYSEQSLEHLTTDNTGSLHAKPQMSFAPLSIHAQARLPEFCSFLFELFCYTAGLLAAVVLPPLASHQFSITEILAMRVSVINALDATILVGLWSSLLFLMIPKRRTRKTPFRSIGAAMLRLLACSGIAMLLIVVRRPAMADPFHFDLFLLVSLSLLLGGELLRTIYKSLVQHSIRRERSVLIVGSGWRGQRVADELSTHPRWSYNVLGFVDSAPPENSGPVLGGVDTLETILMSRAVDQVIITLPVKSMYDDIQRTIVICERVGVECTYSTDLFHTHIIKSRAIDQDDPSSVMLLHMIHRDAARDLKRAVDILVAGAGLVCLLPVLLLIAISIKVTSEGPVLFRQKRYGLNKRLFTIYKFRTMTVHAENQQALLEHLNENDGPTFKIKNDPRVTKLGSFLRRTSLDELPQLWNVFIGDMSLVGPRPLPMRDVSRFSEGWLMRRFSVPPGITGLWQVSGRSNLSFSHWIKLDLDYIDRWSLLLDFKILAKTFPTVFRRDGAV